MIIQAYNILAVVKKEKEKAHLAMHVLQVSTMHGGKHPIQTVYTFLGNSLNTHTNLL